MIPELDPTCERCKGTGHLPAYVHVQAGVCFRCKGTGEDLLSALRKGRRALSEARRQWASLRRSMRQARGVHKKHMREELDTLTKEGKTLRAKVEDLQHRFDALRS